MMETKTTQRVAVSVGNLTAKLRYGSDDHGEFVDQALQKLISGRLSPGIISSVLMWSLHLDSQKYRDTNQTVCK